MFGKLIALSSVLFASYSFGYDDSSVDAYLNSHPEQTPYAAYMPAGSEDDMKLSFSMYLKALGGDKTAQEYFGEMILHRFGTDLDVEHADFWLRMSSTSCGGEK